MIVCSCNVLSDTQILAAIQDMDSVRPCSPARVYRCLGCAPKCGRCIANIRALLAKTHLAHVEVGCETCPSHAAGRGEVEPAPYLIAAE